LSSAGSGNVRAHGFGGPRREQSPEIGTHTHACFFTHAKIVGDRQRIEKLIAAKKRPPLNRFPPNCGKELKGAVNEVHVIFPDHIRNTGIGIRHQRFCSQRFT